MPRPKVLDECRQRIAKACLDCQAAKQKCDGLVPCIQCRKRGKSNTCAYSTHQRSYGRQRKRISTGPRMKSPGQDPRPPSNRMLSPEAESVDETGGRTADVTIPKLPHHLYDTNGRVLYLGDCAALSFLQNIQELMEGETELATVAADVANFPVYEEVSPVRDGYILAYKTMDVQDIEELVEVFFASTCGILDIFGKVYVEDLLSRWADGSLESNGGNAAVLYLTIAYAAQARSATVMDVHRAQTFYDRGRQIAALELTNDPSVETVQAFILVSLYMLGCSRRNGAYLNLGIAISAAKSLGFHRDETNAEFPESEGSQRKRIWRTLQYHDLFFCAMMGRTSAILTTDSTVLDEQQLISNSYSPDFCQELGLLESIRAFSFLERTVNEVYTKQTVPLGLLQRICQELQGASSKVPAEMRTPIVANSLTGPRRSLKHILRNANVACNYYFSMMLLTRPFLITSLRAKHSRPMMTSSKIDERATNYADAKIYIDITHGATTSIDSAVKTIQLLHELMVAGLLFNNMPLTVAWTFVAALAVCSAYFGRLGGLEECEHAIQQADEILQHFSRNSPQARCYRLILEKLSRAALDYVKSLEQKEQTAKNMLMPELFRLNSAESAYTSGSGRALSGTRGSTGQQDKWAPPPRRSYSFTSEQAGEGESSGMDSGAFSVRTASGVYNQGNSSTTSDSTSLLDLAHSFHDLNNPALDMGSNVAGDHIIDSMFDFENTESIWDLSWGGAIL